MQNLYKTYFKTFILVTLFLVIACKKDETPITPQPEPEPVKDTVVYVAGSEKPIDTYEIAVYWKNGVPVRLSDGTTHTKATAIFVSGKDVQVVGYEQGKQAYVAKYWKNGVSIDLPYIPKPSDNPNAPYGAINTFANSIFVSGNDVYIAGVVSRTASQIAMYWKNGIPVELADGSSTTLATSIFVSGNDVYVAGTDHPVITDADPQPRIYAKYWKNGVAVTLTDGKQQAKANSIFVSGTDVYVAGYEYKPNEEIFYPTRTIAKYWKNGNPIELTDGSKAAEARSIILSNNDIYVTGSEERSPSSISIIKTWKNGTVVNVTDGQSEITPPAMYVLGSDVYVAGAQNNGSGNIPSYWKNGVKGEKLNLLNSQNSAIPTSVFVTIE